MALRVLLADESSTIKKVMQLALQDFAIEVKSVPIGLDVIQVAKGFRPDIIFADVLLSKRNGYEVAGDIKADASLKNIPVVLMWSGFMELDEAKAQESKADRRLEKPFDAETLRSMVKELVPSTSGNLISQFLSFPDMPEMIEEKAPPVAKPAAKPSSSPASSASQSVKADEVELTVDIPILDEIEDLEEIEEPEEFQSVPLPKESLSKPGTPAFKPKSEPTTSGNDSWSRQDLSKFRIELPAEDDFSMVDSDLSHTSIALSSGVEEIDLADIDKPMSAKGNLKENTGLSKTFGQKIVKKVAAAVASPDPAQYSGTNLNSMPPNLIEDAVRAEARASIEAIAWKILPDIVERVVREELQKLLKDAERL